MFTLRFRVLATMILLAAATRLLPHPPNFAPITAMALFGGVYFEKRWHAFLVPFVVMIFSDLIIGFHPTILFVYASFALIILIGLSLRKQMTLIRTASAMLGSSILFFLITNFSVWLMYETYPKTLAGLITCYVAAIPFFHNSLVGDLFYSTVLFGGFALAQRFKPSLSVERSIETIH
ncbi:MAG: hypothetical protein A3I05_01930 [Deltaproteobacteria bacterium RIFCSPLOWO2_02_FULL_44_10]|nr:MAG: hypothetical protein A3C46_08100 [Deltaproteobacteria bacterium RIFCSPHIGHO2_02_FULL_44_16]OGQ47542.1 MAG: hypothetical protein A3I05_01930 [Deltaproteobacteria bacterium RIFCSPLOWO2_02_FULL_44_10]